MRTFSWLPDAAVDQQWTVAFTPATPLQIIQPLPGGTLVVTGNPGWTRGGESIDLTVSTPTPIHYSAAACGRDPDIRFVAD